MPVITWRGDAQPIAQQTTITIGGTPSAGNVVTVTINRKEVTWVVQTGQTTAQIAAALADQLSACRDPEYSRIAFTNDSTPVITCTATTAGVPFILTTSVTGSVTAVVATVRNSRGPNHLDDPDNYSSGTLPVSGDDLIIPDGSSDILYGLDALSAVNLASLKVMGGSIGLRNRNPDGYMEYLPKVMVLGGCGQLTVGDGIVGASYCRLRIEGSGTCAVKIDNGQALSANVNDPAVLLTSGGTVTLNIDLVTGSLGLATDTGEAANVGTLKIGTYGVQGSLGASDEAASATWGASAVVGSCILYAGEVRAYSSTNVTMQGGIWTQCDSNVGSVDCTGGTFAFNSSGTMGTVNFNGSDAVLDLSADTRPLTSIASLTVTNGARLIDPHKRIGGIPVATDRDSVSQFDWGETFTLTRT